MHRNCFVFQFCSEAHEFDFNLFIYLFWVYVFQVSIYQRSFLLCGTCTLRSKVALAKSLLFFAEDTSLIFHSCKWMHSPLNEILPNIEKDTLERPTLSIFL